MIKTKQNRNKCFLNYDLKKKSLIKNKYLPNDRGSITEKTFRLKRKEPYVSNLYFLYSYHHISKLRRRTVTSTL